MNLEPWTLIKIAISICFVGWYCYGTYSVLWLYILKPEGVESELGKFTRRHGKAFLLFHAALFYGGVAVAMGIGFYRLLFTAF